MCTCRCGSAGGCCGSTLGCSSGSSAGLGVQGSCTLASQEGLLDPFTSALYTYVYMPGSPLAWDAYPNLLNSSFSYTSGLSQVLNPCSRPGLLRPDLLLHLVSKGLLDPFPSALYTYVYMPGSPLAWPTPTSSTPPSPTPQVRRLAPGKCLDPLHPPSTPLSPWTP